jgi:GT2 family glycosyltransferase/predicted small secreted protein
MDYKEEIKNHFNTISADYDYWKSRNYYYYSLIKEFFKKNIPAGSSVVEFGCATGDILAACNPKRGLGLDVSSNIIEVAKTKYPCYEFKVVDVEKFSTTEKFDYVIMSDLLDHLSDIAAAIENANNLLSAEGKLVITTINPLWNPVFGLLERLRLKMPEGPHCFIPNSFIKFFCQLKGFKNISIGATVFIPKKIPFFSDSLNKIIPAMPLINRLCWVQTLIAQKGEVSKKELSYSIIIPTYNEEKNIEDCIKRIPKLEKDYEILVVDDGSRDNTPRILEKIQKINPNLRSIRLSSNNGKAYAVEEGIRHAQKDIIVILDADMSVAPEDLTLFIEPIERGLADFVNGTRLIYNMEKKAMDQMRRIANFLLAILFSLLLKIRITDALCGTKAFLKKDFREINISGERWGDLVLLWTAQNKGLRIVEVPIRYYARRSGNSKMHFFYDGIKFIGYFFKITLRKFTRKTF